MKINLETKFNVGDTVFGIESHGEVKKIKIQGFCFNITEKDGAPKLTYFLTPYGGQYHEDELFPTEESATMVAKQKRLKFLIDSIALNDDSIRFSQQNKEKAEKELRELQAETK